MKTLLIIMLAVLAKLVYSSFFEWTMHRYGMHEKWPFRWAFKSHTEYHHREYQTGKSFYNFDGQYRLIDSSKIPLVWVGHWPIYILLWIFLGPWVAAIVALVGLNYIISYELLHYFIHKPVDHWLFQNRLFYLACEQHRTHHLKHYVNLNVLFPLADLCLRTYRKITLPPEPNAPIRMRGLTGIASVWQKEL